ncbi:MAG: pentapeptide repeat-containing protein, partial [Nocardioides sp.]
GPGLVDFAEGLTEFWADTGKQLLINRAIHLLVEQVSGVRYVIRGTVLMRMPSELGELMPDQSGYPDVVVPTQLLLSGSDDDLWRVQLAARLMLAQAEWADRVVEQAGRRPRLVLRSDDMDALEAAPFVMALRQLVRDRPGLAVVLAVVSLTDPTTEVIIPLPVPAAADDEATHDEPSAVEEFARTLENWLFELVMGWIRDRQSVPILRTKEFIGLIGLATRWLDTVSHRLGWASDTRRQLWRAALRRVSAAMPTLLVNYDDAYWAGPFVRHGWRDSERDDVLDGVDLPIDVLVAAVGDDPWALDIAAAVRDLTELVYFSPGQPPALRLTVDQLTVVDSSITAAVDVLQHDYVGLQIHCDLLPGHDLTYVDLRWDPAPASDLERIRFLADLLDTGVTSESNRRLFMAPWSRFVDALVSRWDVPNPATLVARALSEVGARHWHYPGLTLVFDGTPDRSVPEVEIPVQLLAPSRDVDPWGTDIAVRAQALHVALAAAASEATVDSPDSLEPLVVPAAQLVAHGRALAVVDRYWRRNPDAFPDLVFEHPLLVELDALVEYRHDSAETYGDFLVLTADMVDRVGPELIALFGYLVPVRRRRFERGPSDAPWAELVSIRLALEGPFTRAQLLGLDLRAADLRGAVLVHQDLHELNLSYANLHRSNLQETNLARSNLTGATLTSATLAVAWLVGTDLREANLTGTYLIEADLTGANLTDVRGLEHADLTGARGLPQVDDPIIHRNPSFSADEDDLRHGGMAESVGEGPTGGEAGDPVRQPAAGVVFDTGLSDGTVPIALELRSRFEAFVLEVLGERGRSGRPGRARLLFHTDPVPRRGVLDVVIRVWIDHVGEVWVADSHGDRMGLDEVVVPTLVPEGATLLTFVEVLPDPDLGSLAPEVLLPQTVVPGPLVDSAPARLGLGRYTDQVAELLGQRWWGGLPPGASVANTLGQLRRADVVVVLVDPDGRVWGVESGTVSPPGQPEDDEADPGLLGSSLPEQSEQPAGPMPGEVVGRSAGTREVPGPAGSHGLVWMAPEADTEETRIRLAEATTQGLIEQGADPRAMWMPWSSDAGWLAGSLTMLAGFAVRGPVVRVTQEDWRWIRSALATSPNAGLGLPNELLGSAWGMVRQQLAATKYRTTLGVELIGDFTGLDLLPLLGLARHVTAPGATLVGMDFSDVSIDLAGADFENADLHGANFSRTNLQDANLKGANLQSATFTDATVDRVALAGACLRRANFAGVDLSQVRLSGVDIAALTLAGGLSSWDAVQAAMQETIADPTELVASLGQFDQDGSRISLGVQLEMVARLALKSRPLPVGCTSWSMKFNSDDTRDAGAPSWFSVDVETVPGTDALLLTDRTGRPILLRHAAHADVVPTGVSGFKFTHSAPRGPGRFRVVVGAEVIGPARALLGSGVLPPGVDPAVAEAQLGEADVAFAVYDTQAGAAMVALGSLGFRFVDSGGRRCREQDAFQRLATVQRMWLAAGFHDEAGRRLGWEMAARAAAAVGVRCTTRVEELGNVQLAQALALIVPPTSRPDDPDDALSSGPERREIVVTQDRIDWFAALDRGSPYAAIAGSFSFQLADAIAQQGRLGPPDLAYQGWFRVADVDSGVVDENGPEASVGYQSVDLDGWRVPALRHGQQARNCVDPWRLRLADGLRRIESRTSAAAAGELTGGAERSVVLIPEDFEPVPGDRSPAHLVLWGEVPALAGRPTRLRGDFSRVDLTGLPLPGVNAALPLDSGMTLVDLAPLPLDESLDVGPEDVTEVGQRLAQELDTSAETAGPGGVEPNPTDDDDLGRGGMAESVGQSPGEPAVPDLDAWVAVNLAAVPLAQAPVGTRVRPDADMVAAVTEFLAAVLPADARPADTVSDMRRSRVEVIVLRHPVSLTVAGVIFAYPTGRDWVPELWADSQVDGLEA